MENLRRGKYIKRRENIKRKERGEFKRENLGRKEREGLTG